jgi:hypothetical protein
MSNVKRFARSHNLQIERYYHQFPCWSLRFRHPKGGEACIEICKSGKHSLRIAALWWIDDYDEGIRSGRELITAKIPATAIGLSRVLRESLREILS